MENRKDNNPSHLIQIAVKLMNQVLLFQWLCDQDTNEWPQIDTGQEECPWLPPALPKTKATIGFLYKTYA